MTDLSLTAQTQQRQASDPAAPVWVGASAGSGKTTVLVSRILRLMLPGTERAGTDPARILCITFTKAAASEVTERVSRSLRAWTIASEEDLRADLTKLLGQEPSAQQMEDARALFARVLDAPGGMKIMTIHSFCQSVLARFPMEAGLPAGFAVMEESEARKLMADTRRTLITRLQNQPDDALRQAFDLLTILKSAADLENLMSMMAGQRTQLRRLLAEHDGIDGLCHAVSKSLDVKSDQTSGNVIEAFLSQLLEDDLRTLAMPLSACNKTNQGIANTIHRMLAELPAKRTLHLEIYQAMFLTQKGEVKKPTGILKTTDVLYAVYLREAERLQALNTTLRNISNAACTIALLRFAEAVLSDYEAAKRARNRLDYEDLIDKTRTLLADGVHWVQYKLDGGIDHILVDEAQDTNPDQWDIVTGLADEFYYGASAHENVTRTSFVVGDEKQSIFSFQRADPAVFDRKRRHFAEITKQADLEMREIPLQISFRSTPSILQFVDAVFAPEAVREGVVQNRDTEVRHIANRSGAAGHVEIWPLIKREKPEAAAAWSLFLTGVTAQNPAAELAEKIAMTIRNWLDTGEKLASAGRPIVAGDIMILLCKRRLLAEPILKALRKYDIPVTGIDRMVVSRQLAVQDAVSALSFALLPDDDLNLAALLKSPFAGLDEQALYDLAQSRKSGLWDTVRSSKHKDVTQWLSGLIEAGGSLNVAAFLHILLYRPCPGDSRSGMRALLKRLGGDARDPLEELLARADRYSIGDTEGLQGFLQEILNDESELKREIDEGSDKVRVMTVHGSKGLEAPIVFLPDTIKSTGRSRNEPLLWPDRSDLDVPLWAPREDMRSDQFNAAWAESKIRAEEEYRRLLYVALTRPADRLYIGGAQMSEDSRTDKSSWYFACANAFDAMAIPEKDGVRSISNGQSDPIKDRRPPRPRLVREERDLPQWALEAAPSPENPPRPLQPSQPEMPEPAALSPLARTQQINWFRRGRLIHTLFQFLPDIAEDQRQTKAATWLARSVHKLSAEQQTEIQTAVFGVLDHPDFKDLFTPEGRAEVPLTGMLGDAIVSAQIDRLLVEKNRVTILDYKSNRPAPQDTADVPEAYRRQLRIYRDLLKVIYPDSKPRCCLLWTDGPLLMDLTELL